MPIPNNIDTEAVKLFKEANWPWDDRARLFRRAARLKESDYEARQQQMPNADIVSYDALRHHGLAPEEGDIVTEPETKKGLQWLKNRIKEAEPA